MKKRDSFLFSLPVTAAVLIAAFAAFLYWQIANFEESYLFDAQKNMNFYLIHLFPFHSQLIHFDLLKRNAIVYL